MDTDKHGLKVKMLRWFFSLSASGVGGDIPRAVKASRFVRPEPGALPAQPPCGLLLPLGGEGRDEGARQFQIVSPRLGEARGKTSGLPFLIGVYLRPSVVEFSS